MRIPPARKPIDIEEATRLRVVEGLPATEIAARLGFTPGSIRQALNRAGVSLRPPRIQNKVRWGTQLASVWRSVRQRCTNARNPLYPRYGALGCTVSPEWDDFWAFYDWAIASGYRRGLSIALVGRAKQFSPGTCRWITVRERMARDRFRTVRSSAVTVTAFGESKSTTAWAEDSRCSINAQTILDRLRMGVPPEPAINLPPYSVLPKDRRRKTPSPPLRGNRLDWETIVQYAKSGMSTQEIAGRVGANPDTVRRGLKKRGAWQPVHVMWPHCEPLRKIWRLVRSRCEEENNPSYRYYGARGARLCAVWKDFRNFHQWAVRSGYEPGLCLTRRDGTRIYSPRNCYWITRDEVFDRSKHPDASKPPRWTFEAFGETKGPTEWSRDPRCRVTLSGLLIRLRGGWRPEDALVTPPKTPGSSGNRGRRITAFGCRKSVLSWVRDGRCRVAAATLLYRLGRGVPPEQAIATPPYGLRGRRS